MLIAFTPRHWPSEMKERMIPCLYFDSGADPGKRWGVWCHSVCNDYHYPTLRIALANFIVSIRSHLRGYIRHYSQCQ